VRFDVSRATCSGGQFVAFVSGGEPSCDLLAIAQLHPDRPLTFPPSNGPFDLRPAGSRRYHLSSWMETPSKGRTYYLCEMHEGAAPAYGWDVYGWEVDRFIVCSDC
jgi:hypothetical protein